MTFLYSQNLYNGMACLAGEYGTTIALTTVASFSGILGRCRTRPSAQVSAYEIFTLLDHLFLQADTESSPVDAATMYEMYLS